jgi:hypothetical protein
LSGGGKAIVGPDFLPLANVNLYVSAVEQYCRVTMSVEAMIGAGAVMVWMR